MTAVIRRARPLRRTFVHLVYDRSRGVWRAEVSKQTVRIFPSRLQGMKMLAAHLALMWEMWRIRSELIVHTKSGRIGKGSAGRRTYGDDPRGRG